MVLLDGRDERLTASGPKDLVVKSSPPRLLVPTLLPYFLLLGRVLFRGQSEEWQSLGNVPLPRAEP